jgi:hypothetical protein
MVDDEATERIARERLATSLAVEEVAYASDLALLEQHLRKIRCALLDGEQPASGDITTAHIALDELRDDLDDIESMFSWGFDDRESEHLRAGENR